MQERTERILYFLAILFAALALVPTMAHLLELTNKMGLPQDQYFTVQGIYRGWALLGIVVFGALLASLALTITLRRERAAMMWAGAAFLCIAATQGIFWIYTFPANVATANWTQRPENWETLRSQWEYSHATSAIFNLAALVALILSVLAWATDKRGRPA
jgi:hypothetical protein